MNSTADLKWKAFMKAPDFDMLAEQEKILCTATASIEVMCEMGLKNATRLPDEIEEADTLWIDKYELEKSMKSLSIATSIDINRPQMQAVHVFLLENTDKAYNEILDEISNKLGNDFLTNLIKSFIPSLVLNLKLLSLQEHLDSLYSVRDVEDIKDSIEERLPEEFRRLYKLIHATQEETARLFGMLVEAKGKLYFLTAD